jgi:hypothetical protein
MTSADIWKSGPPARPARMGKFVPAVISRRDNTGIDYSLRVPSDTPLPLRVHRFWRRNLRRVVHDRPHQLEGSRESEPGAPRPRSQCFAGNGSLPGSFCDAGLYCASGEHMAVESWRKRLCLSREHIRRAPGEEMRRAGKYVGVSRAQSPVWRPWGVNKCDPLVVKAPSSVGERLLWQ